MFWARVVAVVAAGQLAVGALNVMLLAPIWMQLVHLLVADVLWIALVLLGATALAYSSPGTAPPRMASPGLTSSGSTRV